MAESAKSRLSADIASLIGPQPFGRFTETYKSVDSTNSVAMDWAALLVPEGSVVVADYQEQGRGRRGKHWFSDPGCNLLFSVILRPKMAPRDLGLITMAASLAVVDVLKSVVEPAPVSIKAPNDILINGKKCCGMLLESAIPGMSSPTVVLGVGLNVNQARFPDDIAEQATSLLLETGQHLPLEPLRHRLLSQLEREYGAMHENPEATRRRYERAT